MTEPTNSTFPDVCVFDAYGTLFDFQSAIEKHCAFLGPQSAVLASCWRQKQLEYTWLRSVQSRYADFEQVTADALDVTLEALQIRDSRLRTELLALFASLPAYPDARRALARLRDANIRSLVLSNGTPDMLDKAIEAAELKSLVNGVLSVDAVRVFKPDPRVYQLAVDELRIPANRIVFVSANGWDSCGAAAFGFRAVWCNRGGKARERLPGTPEIVVRSLDEIGSYIGLNDGPKPAQF